jgi:hypothetical protein
VPEATLVLKDGPLAGWCSDGTFWGLRYFTGQETTGDTGRVYESAIRAFARRVS